MKQTSCWNAEEGHRKDNYIRQSTVVWLLGNVTVFCLKYIPQEYKNSWAAKLNLLGKFWLSEKPVECKLSTLVCFLCQAFLRKNFAKSHNKLDTSFELTDTWTTSPFEIGEHSADQSNSRQPAPTEKYPRIVYTHTTHLSKIFKSIFVRQDVCFLWPTVNLHCPAVRVVWFVLPTASTDGRCSNSCSYHHQNEYKSPHLWPSRLQYTYSLRSALLRLSSRVLHCATQCTIFESFIACGIRCNRGFSCFFCFLFLFFLSWWVICILESNMSKFLIKECFYFPAD